MAKIISVFNNKGGVGKTTILWNLADTIARSGRRVLLIDFDPQCNLSIAMLGTEAFTSVLPTMNQPYGTTIRAYLQRFLQNTGGEQVFVHSGKNTHENARLIAGDFWLNVYAEQLSLGSDLLTGTGVAKYVVIRRVVKAAEELEKKPFDYVLVDLSPSFGSLVRAALYSSDYFLVPCTSDNFSAYCVGLIGQMLPAFVEDWDTGLNRFKQANPHYAEYEGVGHPKFAGWIYNGFDTRSDNVVPADRAHQTAIESAVSRDLAGELAKQGLVAGGIGQQYQIGEIEDMNVLAQNSLHLSVPVSQLGAFRAQALGSSGGWSPSQRKLIEKMETKFSALSTRVQAICT